MPVYKWVAETRKGKILKGELEAADEKIAQLQENGQFPIVALQVCLAEPHGHVFLVSEHEIHSSGLVGPDSILRLAPVSP